MFKKGLSRREFLKSAMIGGAGLALGARGLRFSLAQDSLVQIMETGANLPTDATTFRWIDSGDQKAVFWNVFFDAYQQAHPNITVQYDPLPWNEIAQVVPLGVRNGTAHDVFQIPLAVTLAQAVSEGWVSPLDDIIPNFEEWKAGFPSGALVEGVTGFDGKTYAFPLTSNKRYGSHLLYNVDYMQEAGYDPATMDRPMTVDEFRDAARKITENGAGSYYGFIIGGNQVNRWGDIVTNFARMAGASSMDGIDYRTGEYIYTDPRFVEGINVLLALRDDNSMFPGTLSLNAPEARARMPQGAAGMILQGPWNIPIWQAENPDFNFDLASQPLLEEGTMVPLSVGPGGDNRLHIFAQASDANKQIAGDIFAQMGTVQGQVAWATLVGAADSALFPEAIEQAEMDPLSRKALLLFNEQMRVAPSPVVRNPEVSAINLELQPVSPNLSETIQGIYTGQITDIAAALQDLNDRSNAELDRAIAAAQEKGANVSREDYVFPNWDPTQDFGEADYAASM